MSKCNRAPILLAALLVSTFAKSQSIDEPLIFRGIYSVNSMTHGFLDHTNDPDEPFTGRADFNAFGVGVAKIFSSQWYLDAQIRKSEDATHDYDKEAGYSTANLPFKRTDMALNLGKVLEDGWKAYFSLAYSSTEWGRKFRAGLGSLTYQQTGLGIGVQKSFNLSGGEWGVLSPTIGLVRQTGKVKFDYVTSGEKSDLDGCNGLVYGVNYSYPLHQDFLIGVDYRSQRFVYNRSSEFLSYDDKIKSFGLTVSYIFH